MNMKDPTTRFGTLPTRYVVEHPAGCTCPAPTCAEAAARAASAAVFADVTLPRWTPGWTPVLPPLDVAAAESAERWNDRLDENGFYIDPAHQEEGTSV